MSGSVGIPISLVSGSRVRDEMRIVPFITPGLVSAAFTAAIRRVDRR